MAKGNMLMGGNVENLVPFWGEWDATNAADIDELAKMMEQYGSSAERVIEDVLHGEGASEIKREISRLLPQSGRRWRGKKPAASRAMPGKFAQDNDLLSVTIAARGAYSYLYFPDDGTNTKNHAGNQQFMRRGAERATPKIIELCLGRLV